MYYILAECAETPEEASNFLNSVREVRGIDPVSCTSQTVQSEIEKEYRKEFYGEGQMFYFFKRNNNPLLTWPEVMTMSAEKYRIPKPEGQIIFE